MTLIGFKLWPVACCRADVSRSRSLAAELYVEAQNEVLGFPFFVIAMSPFIGQFSWATFVSMQAKVLNLLSRYTRQSNQKYIGGTFKTKNNLAEECAVIKLMWIFFGKVIFRWLKSGHWGDTTMKSDNWDVQPTQKMHSYFAEDRWP